jgi:hypothetical protein
LVPERVYQACPNTKLILMLRNPIDRAYSQYQMERRKGREPHDTFELAIKDELERIEKAKAELLKAPLSNHHFHENTSYLSRGKYIEQIEIWLKWFDLKDLLVCESETFFNNPESGLNTVHSFLGIKHIFPNDLTPRNMVNYSPLTPQLREELDAFYEPYNQRLEQLLGRKLNW